MATIVASAAKSGAIYAHFLADTPIHAGTNRPGALYAVV